MPDPDIAAPGAPLRHPLPRYAATVGASGDVIRSVPVNITDNPTGGIFAPVKGRPLSAAKGPEVPEDRSMVRKDVGRRDMDPKDRAQGTVLEGSAGRLEIMAPVAPVAPVALAATVMAMSMGRGAGVMGRTGREIR